jgi:hypothetical protein
MVRAGIKHGWQKKPDESSARVNLLNLWRYGGFDDEDAADRNRQHRRTRGQISA